ncbi:MAG: Fe-Mn family superoxide dismutase [bacterium]
MYIEKQFNLKDLKGFSEKQINEHLKLYAGYVKNTNSLMEKLDKMRADKEADAYIIAELKRRIGFEFSGMRLHEYYFDDLSGTGLISDGDLKKDIAMQYGTFENWLTDFKSTAMLRGTGWAILTYDQENKRFFNTWVNSHELGHLAGTKILLALDVWEHAFLIDYTPGQRKDYIESFFSCLNWSNIEKRYK